jgi:anti-sigma factor RsiW
MNHIESGELQAYLDSEVSASARAQIDAHVHACAACSAELAQLRADATLFKTALTGIDVTAPVAIARTVLRHTRTPAPSFATTSRANLAKAALFIIGFAAIASAALPGSPVRKWLTGALRTVGVIAPAATPAPATSTETPRTATAPATAPVENAVSITPDDAGAVRIALSNVAPNTTIRVHLVDGLRAQVQTTGLASRARFSTGPGRIEINGVTAGEVTISLPRNASDARIVVDGKTLFQKGAQPELSEYVFKTGH